MAATTQKQTIRGRDRISELPEEILHGILHRIDSPMEEVKTTVLSKRWRTVWSSYPVLKNPPTGTAHDFRNFVDYSIDRFSRHKQLRVETLEVLLPLGSSWSPDDLDRLVKLASERIAEEISVRSVKGGINLPCTLFSDSCTKFLRLQGVRVVQDFVYSVIPKSRLFFGDLEVGAIGPLPHLETLELDLIHRLRRLRISGVPNLRTLTIQHCFDTEHIEIEAAGLETLNISRASFFTTKLEFIVPQLKHLELRNLTLDADNLYRVISKLTALKTLTLGDLDLGGEKLKLSCPKLEVFRLQPTGKQGSFQVLLAEMELDAGPSLSRFVVDSGRFDELQRCEISIACRWEVNFTMRYGFEKFRWFSSKVKGYLARCPRFHTVNISIEKGVKVMSDEDEMDEKPCSMAINHLELCTDFSTKDDQDGLLKALFWECRPKFFTVIHTAKCSLRFFQNLLKKMSPNSSTARGVHIPPVWQDWLKDVKIVTSDVDRTIKVGEGELMNVSKDMARSLAAKKRVSFMLTWC